MNFALFAAEQEVPTNAVGTFCFIVVLLVMIVVGALICWRTMALQRRAVEQVEESLVISRDTLELQREANARLKAIVDNQDELISLLRPASDRITTQPRGDSPAQHP